MLIEEKDYKDDAVLKAAEQMCIAARTAPKGKGIDNIVTAIANGDTIGKLADRMVKIKNEQGGSDSLVRDAENIRGVSHIVLIGTKLGPVNLKACRLCGYETCEDMVKNHGQCSLNTIDLGIAIGAAVSKAADLRIDNRIMFSIGRAAVELGMLGKDVKIAMGIPLSATAKNPFFDRK